jgi:mono/diheme cytochrome c family protein
MPEWRRIAGPLAACIGLLAMPVLAADEQRFSNVERGKYLVAAADCSACHTYPGVGQRFAGGRPIETPFGTVVAANITPDRETGIGSWTDEEFIAAVKSGTRKGGAHLYPAMPYLYFAKMSDDDVRAMRAYLATVPAVSNRVATNQLPFPFNIRAGMVAWNLLYFRPGVFKPVPDKSHEWNRGAYLVEGPGHCGACHTPKSFLGGDEGSRWLQGSPVQGWFAPEITSNPRLGVGAWSAEDIVSYLATGRNRISSAAGPMAEVVAHSTSRMSDADLKAIATYLKDTPGSSSAAPRAESAARPEAGGAIYRDVCSACHAPDGKGVPRLIPSLADSPSLRSDDPSTIVRVVLRGTRSVATDREPTAPAMPSFGWQLNDAQIAAVLNYVRNQWGSTARTISENEVMQARAALAQRTD